MPTNTELGKRDDRAKINDGLDPAAVEAAQKGEVPPPAPGMDGESDPSQPSRAEIFAIRPELADSVPGTPTEGHGHDDPGDEPPHRRRQASE